jgi:hypothetical protein
MVYPTIQMTMLVATVLGLLMFHPLMAAASPVDIDTAITTSTADSPQFPDQPPSCPVCAQGYGTISSCAQAAPVLANFSMVSKIQFFV